MAQTFADRITLAMEKKGMKYFSELSAKADVAPNSLATWMKKGEIPRGRSRLKIGNALDVSYEWLLTGEGPMELPPAPKGFADDDLQQDLSAVMEAVNQVDGFCATFRLSLSGKGKLAVAGLLVQLMGSLGARTLDEIPLEAMGKWSQDVLRLVQSGEIK